MKNDWLDQVIYREFYEFLNNNVYDIAFSSYEAMTSAIARSPHASKIYYRFYWSKSAGRGTYHLDEMNVLGIATGHLAMVISIAGPDRK